MSSPSRVPHHQHRHQVPNIDPDQLEQGRPAPTAVTLRPSRVQCRVGRSFWRSPHNCPAWPPRPSGHNWTRPAWPRRRCSPPTEGGARGRRRSRSRCCGTPRGPGPPQPPTDPPARGVPRRQARDHGAPSLRCAPATAPRAAACRAARPHDQLADLHPEGRQDRWSRARPPDPNPCRIAPTWGLPRHGRSRSSAPQAVRRHPLSSRPRLPSHCAGRLVSVGSHATPGEAGQHQQVAGLPESTDET